MANRVVIKISGEELTLLTEDAPEYVRKVGAYVNDQMRNVVKAAKVGQTRAAIMAAVNIADELYKTREQDEQLRNQIKHYLEESSRQKGEISDLKREVLRLQKAQKKMEQEGGVVAAKPARPSRAKTTRSKTAKTPTVELAAESAAEPEKDDAPTGISSKTARVTALLDKLDDVPADGGAETAAPVEAAEQPVEASEVPAPVEGEIPVPVEEAAEIPVPVEETAEAAAEEAEVVSVEDAPEDKA